jgi:hypothetical protein
MTLAWPGITLPWVKSQGVGAAKAKILRGEL